jgi:hypothetical protein
MDIIVGNIPNRRGNPPNSSISDYYANNNIPFDSGLTTRYPVIDRTQPVGANGNLIARIGALGINNSNIVSDYSNGYTDDSTSPFYHRVECPELMENMFYIYKVYPYVMAPDPTVVSLSGSYPLYPYYRPEGIGDVAEEYSYILPIERFTGSKSILCGISIDFSNNWVVGADNGIFYSTVQGMNVNRAENIIGEVPAVIKTSSSILIASIVSDDGSVQIATSEESTGNPLGSAWKPVFDINVMFYKAGVNRIYNFAEYEGKIYASTNAGLFIGNLSGSEWRFEGSVGDLESLSGGKVLGQGFKVS